LQQSSGNGSGGREDLMAADVRGEIHGSRV
jgi:hypothetical protein